MSDLATKPCTCGATMQEVIRADVPNVNGTRVGWYCPVCKAFKKATARERITGGVK